MTIATPNWVLKVDGLGKIYGPATQGSLDDTGPTHGTSRSRAVRWRRNSASRSALTPGWRT